MNRLQLARFLRFLDLHDQWIFTTQMAGVFFKESDNTLRHGLARNIRNEAIVRPAKGYTPIRSPEAGQSRTSSRT